MTAVCNALNSSEKLMGLGLAPYSWNILTRHLPLGVRNLMPLKSSGLAMGCLLLVIWRYPFSQTASIVKPFFSAADRKSVVLGTSVSVRVDLGGRRIFNKKNDKQIHK